MDDFDQIERCVGFQWDDGNENKNWEKHGVSDSESEEVFFNDPLVVGADENHSEAETRYFALGRTEAGRHLFVAFTIREDLLRVISARDMTRNELKRYLQ